MHPKAILWILVTFIQYLSCLLQQCKKHIGEYIRKIEESISSNDYFHMTIVILIKFCSFPSHAQMYCKTFHCRRIVPTEIKILIIHYMHLTKGFYFVCSFF